MFPSSPEEADGTRTFVSLLGPGTWLGINARQVLRRNTFFTFFAPRRAAPQTLEPIVLPRGAGRGAATASLVRPPPLPRAPAHDALRRTRRADATDDASTSTGGLLRRDLRTRGPKKPFAVTSDGRAAFREDAVARRTDPASSPRGLPQTNDGPGS